MPALLAPITSSGGGISIAAGDVNHDGLADIAVINDNKSITVRIGNGDGTFRSPIKLGSAQGAYLYEFGFSDWNADGNLDVGATLAGKQYSTVTTSWYEQTFYRSVWLGHGDGTFGHRSIGKSSPGPYSPVTRDYIPQLVSTDINRDGSFDFVRLDPAAGTVTVELGNGDGTYQPPRAFAAGTKPTAIAAGDFNGDGWADIVVTDGSTVSVLLNDGMW